MDLRISDLGISDVSDLRISGSRISGLVGQGGLTSYLTGITSILTSSEVNEARAPVGALGLWNHGRMGAGTHPWYYPSWYTTLGTPLAAGSLPSGMLAALHAYGTVLWAQNGHCVTLKWTLKSI